MYELSKQALTVIDPNKPTPRSADDVVAMAAVVQANVVQLRNAECKRAGRDVADHDIRVASPGSVMVFREALIDWRSVKAYSDAALHMRLHEAWGQYCLFCWLWNFDDANACPGFAAVPVDRDMRCQSVVEVKVTELEGHLWSLQFEQRMRNEEGFRDREDFEAMKGLARMIPVKVFGRRPASSSDQALLTASCELAGMLAAARWSFDMVWTWNQAGIMDVDAEYFEEIARQAE